MSTLARLGFHYFPDTLHYREQDLQTWAVELTRLGAAWLTLLAPVERAIPELFLSGMLQAGIKPVLHFPLSAGEQVDPDALRPLFSSYVRWGVRYAAFFDRPNLRQAWPGAIWSQSDLVERFLDRFIPLAQAALQEGLAPLFPPLEPGGDYWDLAFLRLALRGLARRNCSELLDVLGLGLSAWKGEHSLDWGAGGPERWPGARPYFTPPGVQDHQGFRIFDWYMAITRQELGCTLPVMILRAGSHPPTAGLRAQKSAAAPEAEPGAPTSSSLEMALLAGEHLPEAGNGLRLPAEVLACNLWLLAADAASPALPQAWFKPDGSRLPVVDEVRQWVAAQRGQLLTPPLPDEAAIPLEASPAPAAPVKNPSAPPAAIEAAQPPDSQPLDSAGAPAVPSAEVFSPQTAPALAELAAPAEITAAEDRPAAPLEPSSCGQIAHYILLPMYAWGAADWDLDLIRPLMQETHPTIGFSLVEARLARRVTVVGGEQAFSPETLSMLRSAGCQVERLASDGTILAP
jgi:hypothetical protein